MRNHSMVFLALFFWFSCTQAYAAKVGPAPGTATVNTWFSTAPIQACLEAQNASLPALQAMANLKCAPLPAIILPTTIKCTPTQQNAVVSYCLMCPSPGINTSCNKSCHVDYRCGAAGAGAGS